jgi:hypothetical protein
MLQDYAKQLLHKEPFLSNDSDKLYRSLKNVLYDLRELQLEQACVTSSAHGEDERKYRDLEKLIIQVNNRIRVLPYEQQI